MILLIKSRKHYSLISSSGATAGGWELPAAVTEVVLEGIGHGWLEVGQGGEGVQRQETHPGAFFSPSPFCPFPVSLGQALWVGIPQFSETIMPITSLKGISGRALHPL